MKALGRELTRGLGQASHESAKTATWPFNGMVGGQLTNEQIQEWLPTALAELGWSYTLITPETNIFSSGVELSLIAQDQRRCNLRMRNFPDQRQVFLTIAYTE